MTPDMMARLMQGGPQGPQDPEAQARAEAFRKQATEFEIAQRRLQLDYAWLFCHCKPYFDWDNPGSPAQAECAVHGQQMVTLDGRVL